MNEAQKRAKAKYQQKVKRISIDFYPTEQELWEHIEKQPQKQTYIKDLVRQDLGTSTPMLMEMLKNAKENGYKKIVMTSTKRVVGTVDELEEVGKALAESGVPLETLDGSHNCYTPDMFNDPLVDDTIERAEREANHPHPGRSKEK